MRELSGLLKLDARSVYGGLIGDVVKDAPRADGNVIHHLDHPVYRQRRHCHSLRQPGAGRVGSQAFGRSPGDDGSLRSGRIFNSEEEATKGIIDRQG